MKLYEDPPVEITDHPGHKPGHTLELVTTDGRAFQCNGCQEPGNGKARTWYKCGSGCDDYDLHMCCALAERTLEHPLIRDRKFEFLIKPTAHSNRRTFCDACGEEAGGFVYHSNKDDLDLHPCCATLSDIIDDEGHVIINLCKKANKTCAMCGYKGSPNIDRPWAYRWEIDGRSEYLHVACMKKTALKNNLSQGAGGGGMVEASVPIVKKMLQSRRRNTGSSSWFERFTMIIETIGSIIVAVITGNPVAMITAVIGPVKAAIRGLSDRPS